jgi:arsenate reductase
MKKIYCLSTCSTCNRILGEIAAEMNVGPSDTSLRPVLKGFTLQDIKTEKITPAQLDEMKNKAGSYEALFSRRALKYKELGLKDKQLTEKDYRRLILEEYTFLKRPVAILGEKIFVGSEKKTVESLRAAVR